MRELFFWIFSALVIAIVALIPPTSNAIYRITYLSLVFLGVSILFILLGFTFIGLTYIIVYVGAISILFVFTVMMINQVDL